jgi:uncharacterized protein (DUF983 family)
MSQPERMKDPGMIRVLWWGFTRRCPRCGGRRIFRHYFTLLDDCPRCGLHFDRGDGYFTGALAINIAFVSAIFAVTFIVALALTIPEVPVAPLLAIFIPLMTLGPILFYPFSKTVWMAVDRALLHRMDPNDRAALD